MDDVSGRVADDAEFENLMSTISQVYSLRAGHTLTDGDFEAIQRFDKHFRDQEANVIDAFHQGYTQGLREGGSADILQLKERLSDSGVNLAVQKALRTFADSRVAQLTDALDAVETHFGPFADITVNGQHDPEDVRVIALVRDALGKAQS